MYGVLGGIFVGCFGSPGAWSGNGAAVVGSPCGVGGGAVLCNISGAAVEIPWMIPCMRMLDCWNSWAIVPRSVWRLVVWLVMVVVVASCRRSVCWFIVVVSEPNFSSSFSSNSFMVFVRYFSVKSGLGLVALPMA